MSDKCPECGAKMVSSFKDVVTYDCLTTAYGDLATVHVLGRVRVDVSCECLRRQLAERDKRIVELEGENKRLVSTNSTSIRRRLAIQLPAKIKQLQAENKWLRENPGVAVDFPDMKRKAVKETQP